MIEHVYLCGGTSLFRAFMKSLCGERIEFFAVPGEMPLSPADRSHHSLYVILPRYEEKETVLPFMDMFFMQDLLQCKKNGARIYVENYPCRDYLSKKLFGYFTMGKERCFFQENVLHKDRLMQASSSCYLPSHVADAERVILRVSDCVGLHEAGKEGTFSYPVLTDDGCGAVGCMMNLTDLDFLSMRPYGEWKEFLCRLWAGLLDISFEETSAAFEAHYPMIIRSSGGEDEQEAFMKSLRWQLDSGLLYAPDGTKGTYEMIRSDDLLFRTNLRIDSILMTGALLAGAGDHLRDDAMKQIGINLGDFVLKRNLQTPQGFIPWYDNSTVVYSNDLARHGLALLYLWETTGIKRFYDAAEKTASAAEHWLHSNGGLCCGFFDIQNGYEARYGNPSGVFHGELSAFLLKLDAARYAPVVEKILEKLDVDSQSIGHSKPDVWSRCFLLYACAHQTVRDCSEEIRNFLDYYETLQEKCGGFREEDVFRKRSAVMEAGVAQGGGKDCIGDLLYCNNYLFAVLEILHRKMPLDSRINTMYAKLKRFILHTQIQSPDKRFHGAWMRAYDMELQEYYGLLLDRDWGPYCIMGAWTMGIIPLTLLSSLGGRSFFVKK